MSSWVNPFALVSSESEFNQDPSATPEPREEPGEEGDSCPPSSATSSGYSSPVFVRSTLRYATLRYARCILPKKSLESLQVGASHEENVCYYPPIKISKLFYLGK
jgi:hypothetical protein